MLYRTMYDYSRDAPSVPRVRRPGISEISSTGEIPLLQGHQRGHQFRRFV